MAKQFCHEASEKIPRVTPRVPKLTGLNYLNRGGIDKEKIEEAEKSIELGELDFRKNGDRYVWLAKLFDIVVAFCLWGGENNAHVGRGGEKLEHVGTQNIAGDMTVKNRDENRFFMHGGLGIIFLL